SDALRGEGTQVESSLDVTISDPVEIDDLDTADPDDFYYVVTITIIERIGRGESQQEVPTLP
ncbi:MAG: hypothetical protein WAM94_01805, partial [Chromatiaceae bacterium]